MMTLTYSLICAYVYFYVYVYVNQVILIGEILLILVEFLYGALSESESERFWWKLSESVSESERFWWKLSVSVSESERLLSELM